jgi:hypothetical protein
MASSESKFKPGDIITNIQDKTRYDTVPTLMFLRHSNTWKVSSLEPNGDYNLIALDTLTATPLIDKHTKEEKTGFVKKVVMESPYFSYRIWDAGDVKAIYKRIMEELKKEKDKEKWMKAHNVEVVAELTPKIKTYFKNKNSIEETVKRFNLELEDVWNVIDEKDLELAKDYSNVKKKLFGKDDEDFNTFEATTEDIVKDNQTKNASAKSVLDNQDLNREISEYFRKSKKGGRTSKKGGRKSKKGGRTSKKRGRTSKKRGRTSKKGGRTSENNTSRILLSM